MKARGFNLHMNWWATCSLGHIIIDYEQAVKNTGSNDNGQNMVKLASSVMRKNYYKGD